MMTKKKERMNMVEIDGSEIRGIIILYLWPFQSMTQFDVILVI